MAAKQVLTRAKLFRNGRSQAVRLPKEFRFPGDEVTLRREGDAVIMEPVRKRVWPKGFWERLTRGRSEFKVEKMKIVLEKIDWDKA